MNNHPKLVNQNSFDTVIMSSSRRLSRTPCDTSITCSQQSIYNAIDRFVKSVENMDNTVLVPNKIRDMDISKITSCNTSARRKTSQCKAPTILHNTDLYAFYQMLHEIKKELMWGPSSGMSAIASSGFSQSIGSINNICNSSMSNNSSFNNISLYGNGPNNFGSNYNIGNLNSLSKYANSSTRNSTNTLSGLSYQSNVNTTGSINNSSSSGNSTGSSSGTSSANSSTNGSTNGHHLGNNSNKYSSSSKEREKHHCRQPSDDSSVSLGSADSTLDIDSESEEVDSVLADRDSSNSQTSDEHTLHLAAAFKHHLQGLHQILDTLTNTADFFCARYQEEVDGLSEN